MIISKAWMNELFPNRVPSSSSHINNILSHMNRPNLDYWIFFLWYDYIFTHLANLLAPKKIFQLNRAIFAGVPTRDRLIRLGQSPDDHVRNDAEDKLRETHLRYHPGRKKNVTTQNDLLFFFWYIWKW